MKKLSLILIITITLLSSISIDSFAEGETSSILSSGFGSTYVIKNDGSLWGWGNGNNGNGNGRKEPQIIPAKILDNVKAVSANSFGSIAVKKDGTLWAWGKIDAYPIANGSKNPNFLYPEKIMDDVKVASKGKNSIAVIKNDDTLWLCGKTYIGDGTETKADSSDGFVKVMSDVKDVYNGWRTVFVIKNDDSLWGWGENSRTELANMSTEDSLIPVKILDDVKLVRYFGEVGFAIRKDNSLYSWGQGYNDGIYTEDGWVGNVGSPYKVMDNVQSVTAGNGGIKVLVIKTDDTLWGWNNEWNDEGKQMTPYKYADNVASVSNGERHSAVVMKDNTLWTMGGNYRSALGYDSKEVWNTPLTKILEDIQDSPASWAKDEVEKAIGEQLIPEDMQGDYTKSITREEFCILAIRMIEVKAGKSIDEYIEEVGAKIAPIGTFYDCDTKDVRAAKGLGIVKGTSETTFEPDLILNRETAAVFLTRTAEACGRNIELRRADYVDLDQISDWAKDYTGYVYDIGVIKGTAGGKFEPQGSYQRQQAFMTMYRIWKSIDSVNTKNAKLSIGKANDDKVVSKIESNKNSISVDDLKLLINKNKKVNEFKFVIEGSSLDKDSSYALKYDIYYKDANVRIDTYMENKKIAKAIYNNKEDKTTTEYMAFTNSIEVIDGNMLPIRLLNTEFVKHIELNNNDGTFYSEYQTLNGEKVLYIKTTNNSGLSQEFWYSLNYIAPIKYSESNIVDGSDSSTINWIAKSIDKKAIDVNIFKTQANPQISDASSKEYYSDEKMTGDTRNLLLYEVSTLVSDEDGIEGMMHQVRYYSDASYELLVSYFTNLLKDTDDYSLYVQDGRTSIDGTINGELVIIIVNDYMTTKPKIGKNGVNVNYYD